MLRHHLQGAKDRELPERDNGGKGTGLAFFVMAGSSQSGTDKEGL
jgi:hypothetical protein